MKVLIAALPLILILISLGAAAAHRERPRPWDRWPLLTLLSFTLGCAAVSFAGTALALEVDSDWAALIVGVLSIALLPAGIYVFLTGLSKRTPNQNS